MCKYLGKKKRKIKNRKQRLIEYNENTSDIPRNDPVERIMHCIGNKLTISKVEKILERRKDIEQQQTYSCFKITYYEYPVGSERPRSRSANGFVTNYVPNAKDNKKYLDNLISDIRDYIKIIHTPIFIKCNSYHPMPSGLSVEEMVLFEAGILNPVTKPDFDNIVKSYVDMMIEKIILDDDLVYKAKIEKFFSFLPRVELFIYYEDKFSSKFMYRRIKNRKSFKRLEDHIEISRLL